MEKKIPYGKQSITNEDIEAVVSTLTSDFLTQGPKVNEFEKEFAKYTESEYAVAVNNATSGLHLSALALDLKKGDRVITTPITFAATANCIRFCGAEVWFADINPDSYLLDIQSTKELIESKPLGFFKGIIPVDFAGLAVNLEKFRELADKHNLWLIEDACHAPGGYFTDSKGRVQKCGNSRHADLAVFSFHPVKHIACGEGGMITTNSRSLYKRLLSLRTHGITKEYMYKNDGEWYYEMKELGYNYRLTDIQSALGITQLRKNDNGVARRNELAHKYKAAFHKNVKYQSLPKGNLNAHHLFIIEIEKRKELYDFLKTNNIFAQIHYIPIHTFPYYKNIGYEDANLGNAESYYKKCISLPMYPSLTDKEQKRVISKVLEFINE